MPKKPKTMEIVLALVALGIVGLLVAFGIKQKQLDAPPVIRTAALAVPQPNAYTYISEAAVLHDALLRANPQAGAVDRITDSTVYPGLSPAQLAAHYPTAPKLAWVAKNKAALALLHQGFAYDCAAPMAGATGDFPYYKQVRQLARLLVVESHAQGESGDWAGAAGSALDCMRLGHEMVRGGDDIIALSGAACNAIGRRNIESTLLHLDASTCASAARSIETMERGRAKQADVLRMQAAENRRDLCKEFRTPTWRAEFYNFATEVVSPNWHLWLRSRLTPKQTFLNEYNRMMAADIVVADKPYALHQHKRDVDPLIEWMDDFHGSDWWVARDRTDNAQIILQLALRAYKLQHGQWPPSLNAMVPGYLQKVPIDPCGHGEAMHYRLTKNGPLLYSVGPDGIDNGGKGVVGQPNGLGVNRHFARADSKGDFVAGINE